jgi:hypothetical protein
MFTTCFDQKYLHRSFLSIQYENFEAGALPCYSPTNMLMQRHSSQRRLKEQTDLDQRQDVNTVCARCSYYGLNLVFEHRPSKVIKRLAFRHFSARIDPSCSFCHDIQTIFDRHLARYGPERSAIYVHQSFEQESGYTHSQILAGPDLYSGQSVIIPLVHPGRSFLYPFTHATSVPESFVSYEAVSKWISRCKEHSTCSKPGLYTRYHFPNRHSRGFRAIDCIKGELKELKAAEEFAALSYVWSQVPEQKHTPTVESFRHEMPQLIQDAMTVPMRLGIRFLWVDRYCIDVCIKFSPGLIKLKYLAPV